MKGSFEEAEAGRLPAPGIVSRWEGGHANGVRIADAGNGPEWMRKIERSIAYMAQHVNQPLQVAELAAQANVSPSHYFALFKRQTGRAPIDYFIRLRMQRARTLLDSTTASVKEIAVALGYNDPFYFSRVFKAVNRVAPTLYRSRQKELKPVGDFPNGIAPGMAGEALKAESAARFNGASNYQFA